MHIEINDSTSLRQIQQVFSNYYPYLKIEFFSKRHKKYEASEENNLIDPDILIGDIKGSHEGGVLEIRPLYKVADVEKEFQQRFGLSVQICRKEKDRWEQTTGMDDFTLKDLNEFGRESSDEYILADPEEDIDEDNE